LSLAALAARHPCLVHLTDTRSVPLILRHGLLSAEALCDRHGISGARREALLRRHRASFEPIAPGVVLRDQRMPDRALARCLPTDVDPTDWRAAINARIFLWADRRALRRLLHANPDRAQSLLVFDTAMLLSAHGQRAETSPINSGACGPAYAPRGPATFLPAAQFPRPDGRPVREVTVVGGLDPIEPFLVAVLQGDDITGWIAQLAKRAKSRASTS
jgi:hypothetical protein